MSRLARLLVLGPVVLLAALALPANAGVPRQVFGEDFTATWCTYCHIADCALNSCDSIFAINGTQFIHAETHGQFSPPDPFVTPETSARLNRYAITGYPTMQLDGSIQDVGANVTCGDQINWYVPQINSELAANNGISPVAITGNLTINGTTATLKARFQLLDPGSYTAHQATLYIYEDSVTCCTGIHNQTTWYKVVRMLRSTPINLTTVGQVDSVTQVYNFGTVTPTVTASRLHAYALFEQISGSKTIIQATNFQPPDYALNMGARTASVPSGNGTATFSGTVKNVGATADVIALSMDNGFGWPASIQIQGDPNWYSNYNLPLNPGQTVNLTVRVQTDSAHRIGVGHIWGQSANTGRQTRTGLQVFNGSYAILLVDNDGGNGYGALFATELNNLSYLFTEVGSNPTLGAMTGYDAVVWQTGFQLGGPMAADEASLSAYLDGGGKLYLSSMGYLANVIPPDNFLTNYLGVSSFTFGTAANSALGVLHDPITNGMNMTLNWGSNYNLPSTLVPVAGAFTIFNSDTGHPAADRYQTNTFRTVFNTIPQNVLPTGNPDPNNSQYDLAKTLSWLLLGDQTGVPPLAAAQPRLILESGPNPAHSLEQLRFTLGPANAGVVHLSLLDAGGRLVRNIDTAPLAAGSQSVVWNLQDQSGNVVPNGLYFARLRTATGSATSKVVVIH